MSLQTTYSRQEPFPSEVLERGSYGHTFTLRLAIDPNMQYLPGDSLAILPQNDPERIAQVLGLLGASKGNLLENKSICHVTGNLLRFIRPYTKDREEIDALIAKGRITDFTLPLWEVLEECEGIPFEALLDNLAPLLPRYYSIASADAQDSVDLLIAKTETISWRGEKLMGLCTDYLERRTTNRPVQTYLHRAEHFRLPEDPRADIIMIGPGTGIAPFRAFLHARKELPGRNWLFFGARHEKSDFYYQEELEALVQEGRLELTTAFSRDHADKVYVQHRIEEHADELWDWLQKGAYLYICGDAKKMARDVTAAFSKIAKEKGEPDFFKELKREKRFMLDVY